jgi:hypothetical protein
VKSDAVGMVPVAYGLRLPTALLSAEDGDPQNAIDEHTFIKTEVARLLKDFQFIRGTFGNVCIII